MSPIDQIRAERAKIAQQRAALEKRDAELAVAERVLAEFDGVTIVPVPPEAVQVQPYSGREPSRRDKVLDVLAEGALWATSAEINRAVARKFGFLIKPSSFHPLLTDLKNEGVILRDGNKLALKSRIEQEEAI